MIIYASAHAQFNIHKTNHYKTLQHSIQNDTNLHNLANEFNIQFLSVLLLSLLYSSLLFFILLYSSSVLFHGG